MFSIFQLRFCFFRINKRQKIKKDISCISNNNNNILHNFLISLYDSGKELFRYTFCNNYRMLSLVSCIVNKWHWDKYKYIKDIEA